MRTRRSAITPRKLALAVAATALAGIVAAIALGGQSDAPAYLLPPLLLLAVLSLRAYPGERTLLALIARRRPRRRLLAADSRPRQPHPRALLPRGGSLIACSLAVRPPPARAGLSET